MAGSANHNKAGVVSMAEQRKLMAKALGGGWNREMDWLSVDFQPRNAEPQRPLSNERLPRSR